MPGIRDSPWTTGELAQKGRTWSHALSPESASSSTDGYAKPLQAVSKLRSGVKRDGFRLAQPSGLRQRPREDAQHHQLIVIELIAHTKRRGQS